MKLDLQLKKQRLKLGPWRLLVFALGTLAFLAWMFLLVAWLLT